MSSGLEEVVRPAGTLRHADRVLARGVLLVLLGAFLLGLATQPTRPEEELSFQVARACVRGDGWRIGGTPEAERLLAREVDVGADDAQPVRALFGERYSVWPGEVLASLPFHALGAALALAFPRIEETATASGEHSAWFAHLAAGARGALFTALMGYLLTLAARRLGCTRKVALLTGLSFGLTTFAGPVARGFVVEQQVAFGMLAAFYLLMRLREARGHGRACTFDAIGIGVAAGIALAAAPSCWPAVLVLALSFAVWTLRALPRERALRLCACAGVGPVLALALVAVLGPARFVRAEELSELPPALAHGSWGAFVAPGAGLLFLAPVVVLVVVGLARAWRTRRPFVLALTCALVLALGLPPLFTDDWAGGWSYGPRPLLACLPFLWIGVAFGLQTASERAWGRTLTLLLLGFGLFVQLAGWAVDGRTFRTLALEASPIAFPELDGLAPLERERALARRLPFEPGFAAPWVHWRILRHRVAGMGEEFPVAEVFLLDDGARVSAADERERGFRHLAWVDLVEGGGGRAWPALVLGLALLLTGGFLTLRGLDPSAP